MTEYALQAVSGGSPDISRDRWGRPLVVPPNGGKATPYTRCTTFVDALEDKYGLLLWKGRQTALGVTARDDLRLRVASLGPEPSPDPASDDKELKAWKARMNEVVEQAMEAAGSSAKATIGTALHSFTEAIDRGEKVGRIPAEYRGHITNFRNATAGFEALHVEQFVVQDEYRIGGTADRIYREKTTGRLVIGDLKTGNVEYPHKIAMQLAVYANSLAYDIETGQRAALDVDLERAVVVHLDAFSGACKLHWIDIKAGWEAVHLAAKVRDWRARKGLTTPIVTHEDAVATVTRLLRPEPAEVAAEQALRQATNQAALLIAAESLKGAGAWSDDLQKLAGQLWPTLPAA